MDRAPSGQPAAPAHACGLSRAGVGTCRRDAGLELDFGSFYPHAVGVAGARVVLAGRRDRIPTSLLWSLAAPETMPTVSLEISHAPFDAVHVDAARGQVIWLTSHDHVAAWLVRQDLATGSWMAVGPSAPVKRVAVSHDGAWLALAAQKIRSRSSPSPPRRQRLARRDRQRSPRTFPRTSLPGCYGSTILRRDAWSAQPPTGPTTSTTAGTTTAVSSTTATDTGPRLDLPDGTTDSSGLAGCAKADFLFVVDASGSMANEQASLITSFPGFIATITRTVSASDYHIMAISTDDGMNTGVNSQCMMGGICTCTPAPTCCEISCESGTTCNGAPCDDLPIGPCDYKYGSGRLFDASGESCTIADSRRYMLATQPDLGATFECTANVGTYGSGDEKPMLAAIEAVSPAQNAPGACNDGFLRDDAILVLTFITDEEDDIADMQMGSPGGPQQWYEAMVAAKGGDPEAVVVLGLVGDSNLPNGVCLPDVDPNMNGIGAEAAPRLQSFVDMFPNGVLGSVCAPDYTPFFAEAVDVIDFACDNFEPPG